MSTFQKCREADIESLLKDYGYLIDEEFRGILPVAQKKLRTARTDLIFHIDGKTSIVEIKRVTLNVSHVQQLVRYCKIWKKNLHKRHYLVGKKPRSPDKLQELEAHIKKCDVKIILRYLGDDIPKRLVMRGGSYVAAEETVPDSPLVFCLKI